ncbi:hypothetical protein PCK1_001058 [Pneumocystis canis]|nr:hypothetical protein PCK1_001058 [Pneumocystis canis]
MPLQQTAAIERFKCLWTPHKHQVRKHGILHFHQFNGRVMLYDEKNVLVDDLFMPRQCITSGDEIEFDHHLVSVEDALDTFYSDISSLYIRRQKKVKETIIGSDQRSSRARKHKTHTAIESGESDRASCVSATSRHVLKKARNNASIQRTEKGKKSEHSILASKDVEDKRLVMEDVDVEDIDDISISDEEAYDLFSQ